MNWGQWHFDQSNPHSVHVESSSARQRNVICNLLSSALQRNAIYIWSIIDPPAKRHMYGPSSARQRNVICMIHHRPASETSFVWAIIGPQGTRFLNVNSVKLASFKVASFQGAQQPRLSVKEGRRNTRTVATILVKSLFHGWMLR